MSPKTGERLFDKSYGRVLWEICWEDLESARGLRSVGRGRKENIVFIAQQAIEKALKAVLCAKGIPVPLVHDLGALVGKMPDGIEPPYGYGLARFNDYAGILRYERGHAELSEDDLNAIFDTAGTVLEWARKLVFTP